MPSPGPNPWARRLRKSLDDAALQGDPDAPTLTRYRLLHELGRGGMGVVYQAWDLQLKRDVALKLLRDDRELGSAPERFRREAEVAARLSHPNLVTVYDAGEEQGRMFLVMELVDGRPFSEILRTGGAERMTLVRILEKATRGVASAHDRGVVHRDLKPANILVTQAGEPKVTDFGLVHLANAGSSLTNTGAAMGTPLYMAPEQVSGSARDVSPATDVYALGVVLYEILTGRTPHSADTSVALYRRILEDEPPAPRRLDPGIPRDLETIALKSIEKDPRRRYRDAGAFADDLSRALAGEPIEAQPLTIVTRLLRQGRRRQRLLISVAAVAIAAVSAGWLVRTTLERRRAVRDALARASSSRLAGRIEEARQEFRVVLELDPSNPQARAAFEDLGAELLRREKAKVEAMAMLEVARPAVDRALRATYRRDVDHAQVVAEVDAARAAIRKALDKAPDLAMAHYLLGLASELAGRENEAEASWRDAIRIDPKFGPAHYQLGRRLVIRAFVETISSGIPDEKDRAEVSARLAAEAVAEIEKATSEGSGFNDDLQRDVARVMLAMSHGANRDAIARLCDEGLSRHGRVEGSEYFHWLRGVATPGPEQRTAYDQAIAIRPAFAWALFSRGTFLMQVGEADRAVADYDTALAANPFLLPALLNRGTIRQERGDYASAIDDFSAALVIDPRNPSAFVDRANSRLRMGDTGGAIADYGEAAKYAPRWDAPVHFRAAARMDAGDVDGAITDFNETIRIHPHPEAYLHRAAAYQKKNDPDASLRDLEEALRRASPTWDKRDAVKAEIDRLKKLAR